jgi:hypothetical protein
MSLKIYTDKSSAIFEDGLLNKISDERYFYIPNCIWLQEFNLIPSVWNNLAGLPFFDGVFQNELQTAYNKSELNQYYQVRWYGNNTPSDVARVELSQEYYFRPSATYDYIKFEAFYFDETLQLNLEQTLRYKSEWKKVYKLGNNLAKNFFDSSTWATGQAAGAAYPTFSTNLLNVSKGFAGKTALRGNPITQSSSNCFVNLTDGNLDSTKIYLSLNKYRASKNVTFRTFTNVLASGYEQSNLPANTKSFALDKNFIFKCQNNNPLRFTYDVLGSTLNVDFIEIWSQVFEILNP